MGRKSIDLTGQRFGRLVCVKPTDCRKSQSVIWECLCDCGTVKLLTVKKLRSGNTESCGCLRNELTSARIPAAIAKNIKENTNIGLLKSNKLSKANMSGVRGVYWISSEQKWRAMIMCQGKTHRLGNFTKIEDAIKARKLAEELYFQPLIDKYSTEKATTI